MSARRPAFITRNYVKDWATVLPSSFGGVISASNMKTDEPSEIGRIATVNPANSWWNAYFNELILDVAGMAAVNVNLSPAGFYRFIGGDFATAPFESNAPTGSAGGSNVTGTFADVDDPIDNIDANVVVPTITSSNWELRFTFPTPSTTPTVGDNMACFVVRVIRSAATTDAHPVVGCDLYESGSLNSSLGYRAITESNGKGQVLIFPFDPSSLTNPNCQNVECLIYGIPGESTYASLMAVALVTDTFDADAGVHYFYDSGWIPCPMQLWTDRPLPITSVDYMPTASDWFAGVKDVALLIMDDQTRHNPPNTGPGGSVPFLISPTPPDGFVQCGVFVAGDQYGLLHGMRRAAESSVIVQELGGYTEGGQGYNADSYRRRAYNAEFLLTREEKDLLMTRVEFAGGHQTAIYVNFEPSLDGEYRVFLGGWVTVKDSGPAIQEPVAYDGTGEMLFSKSYTFEEKL